MTQNAETAFDPGSPPAGSNIALQQSHLWPVELRVLDDAMSSARPFAGDDLNADDRAWSARVDAAVQGMDVVSPAALDSWMQAHADSPAPHEEEAELVAIWESHIRHLYGTDAGSEQAPVVVLISTAMDRADAATVEQAATDLRIFDATEDASVDVDEDGWS